MHELIKTLIDIYGKVGDFHITPCDGAIPISEADRLAEEAVEKYTQDVAETAEDAMFSRLLSYLRRGGDWHPDLADHLERNGKEHLK